MREDAGNTLISRAAALLGLALAVSVPSGGCTPDFRGASELDETNQVLAVRAFPPEINPGGTVTLDALVHWPGGAPTLFWLVCIPDVGDTFMSCLTSRVGGGMELPFCGVDPADRLCLAGVGSSVDYTLPTGLFPDDGKDHTFFVNMVASGGDIETCTDVLMGGSPTADCLLSLKRVKVSHNAPTTLNVNPELAGFVFDGEVLDATGVTTIDATEPEDMDIRFEIAVTAEATSVDELYPPDGDPSPFDLVVSWFSTCGRFSAEKVFLSCAPDGPANEPRCSPASVFWRPEGRGDCTVHAVVRDYSGGVSWFTQQLEVR